MEEMVVSALVHGGYRVHPKMNVRTSLGVSEYRIDILAQDKQDRLHLVSLQWQQSLGTAEQKVPFKVICLSDALMSNKNYYKAHFVLGGNGWRYKDFYLSGGLRAHLANADMVSVTSLEDFVGMANGGLL